VLIHCQTSKPVNLLVGREAKPLTDWLQAHLWYCYPPAERARLTS
jgi:hypothetical protein